MDHIRYLVGTLLGLLAAPFFLIGIILVILGAAAIGETWESTIEWMHREDRE